MHFFMYLVKIVKEQCIVLSEAFYSKLISTGHIAFIRLIIKSKLSLKLRGDTDFK